MRPRCCRLNRPSIRSLALAGESCIGKAFAEDLSHRQRETVKIIEWIILRGAIVVTENLFVYVTSEVIRFDRNVGAFRSAFLLSRDQKFSMPLVWTSPRTYS